MPAMTRHGLLRRRDILGLPLVFNGIGAQRLYVTEVVVDPEKGQVVAFLFSEVPGGVPSHLVAWEDVQSLEPEGLIAGGPSAVESVRGRRMGRNRTERGAELGPAATDPREWRILGQRAITEEGIEIGLVSDIVFERETGRVVGYEISHSVIEDLLNGRSLLPPQGRMAVQPGGVTIVYPREPPG